MDFEGAPIPHLIYVALEKVYADLLVQNSDKTLSEILRGRFTIPGNRHFFTQDRHDIRIMRKGNAERYKALLAGSLSSVSSGMPTKLTNMMPGLPVEPVQTVLESQQSHELTLLEAQVASKMPSAILANDKLSKVTFGAACQRCTPFVRIQPDQYARFLAWMERELQSHESAGHLSTHVPDMSNCVFTYQSKPTIITDQELRSSCVETRPLQIVPAGCRDDQLWGRTGDPLKRPGITTRKCRGG
ncbi:hypothetical protein HC256_002585 [Beauveria bassiana]|nr:hypothetical protein HC256_002585 [Beauveria bassiana]